MTDKEYEDLHKNDQEIIPDTTTPEPVVEGTPPVGEGSGELPEDGSVVVGPHGEETIVHDMDEDGTFLGWHKEAGE